jgi:hypothetical protein
LVAVLVVPLLAEESEDVDEDACEDAPPDSLDGVELPVEPESLCEWPPELLPELPPEPLLRRESLRESLL